MKICGLYFCNDPVVEYDHNILSKEERFELQLKKMDVQKSNIRGKKPNCKNIWPFTTN